MRNVHLVGDGPDESGHFSRDGHNHLVRILSTCREVSKTLAQAYLGVPPNVLDGLREHLQAHLEMTADLGRIPLGPGPLDERPTGEPVAGFGDGALAAPFATGVLTGSESQRAHELSRVIKTGQVAEFGDVRDSHGELDAAPRLDSLDDWV
jgi:hypothetical protein